MTSIVFFQSNGIAAAQKSKKVSLLDVVKYPCFERLEGCAGLNKNYLSPFRHLFKTCSIKCMFISSC